jgi:hypothetical protein
LAEEKQMRVSPPLVYQLTEHGKVEVRAMHAHGISLPSSHSDNSQEMPLSMRCLLLISTPLHATTGAEIAMSLEVTSSLIPAAMSRLITSGLVEKAPSRQNKSAITRYRLSDEGRTYRSRLLHFID